MKFILTPSTKSGKYCVILQTVFLLIIALSVIFVSVLKILDFNDRWWDITAGIAFPLSIVSFITGLISITKKREKSVPVSVAVFLGLLNILFILLHSLFISD